MNNSSWDPYFDKKEKEILAKLLEKDEEEVLNFLGLDKSRTTTASLASLTCKLNKSLPVSQFESTIMSERFKQDSIQSNKDCYESLILV